MAIQIYPGTPMPHETSYRDIRIFMAGTIENGNSRDWQKIFFDAIDKVFPTNNIVLYNPRNVSWNTSIEQSIECKEFSDQVNWELDNLENSHIIVFNFEPNTISAITLLEFGMYSGDPYKEMYVHCSLGYHKKGNVDIVCKRENLPAPSSLEALIEFTISSIKYRLKR